MSYFVAAWYNNNVGNGTIKKYDRFGGTLLDTVYYPFCDIQHSGSEWMSVKGNAGSGYKNLVSLWSGFFGGVTSSFATPRNDMDVWGIGFDGTNVLLKAVGYGYFYKMTGKTGVVSDSFEGDSTFYYGFGINYKGDTGNLISSVYSDGSGNKKFREHTGFSVTIDNSFNSPTNIPECMEMFDDVTNTPRIGNVYYADESASNNTYKLDGWSSTISETFGIGSTVSSAKWEPPMGTAETTFVRIFVRKLVSIFG